MSPFEHQLEAIGTALLLVRQLPPRTVWSLTCTNDDDAESPSVLNVFAPEVGWPAIVRALNLGRPTDQSVTDDGDQFVTFRRGALCVSLIQEEQP